MCAEKRIVHITNTLSVSYLGTDDDFNIELDIEYSDVVVYAMTNCIWRELVMHESQLRDQ